MTYTTSDLSLAGQDEWSIVSVVDYYANLKACELLNAQQEKRDLTDTIKLSRRMKAYLEQAVKREIANAYDGNYKIEWAKPEIELCIKHLPERMELTSYPYLILAGSILDQLKVKTPDSYSDCDYSWKKEAFEALATGVGFDGEIGEEFYEHWFGKNSGYHYL